jgi:hypothetical protein
MKLIAPVNDNNLPYPFLPSYASFVNAWSNETVKIIECDNDIIIPIKLIKIGPYKVGELLFYPVRRSGEDITDAEELEVWKKLLPYLSDSDVCIKLVAPSTFFCFKEHPAESKFCPFGDYSVDLAHSDEEALFSNIHPKHRNKIRKAEKSGIVIHYGRKALDDFYMLYKETMERGKLFCDTFEFFQKMYDNSGDDNVICGVAYYNGKPEGGLFGIYTMYSGHYLYGASANDIQVSGSINFLHWEAMKLLKSKGVKRYSFSGARLSDVSGTKLEGIQEFKSRFGGKLNKGYLWKADIQPAKCLLLNSLLKTKFMLTGYKPKPDIIDKEAGKWPNI